MTATDEPNADSAPPSFEAALAELETIVGELEEGEVPLTRSLARYEEGVKLLKQCYQLLAHAERRIELLNHVDPDGTAHGEPFDDEALSLEEKAETRGRRRSRAPESGAQSKAKKMDGPAELF
jgi:exodeoxyribonuclease VII small subunit